MMELETDPGTGLLFIGLAVFVVLGFLLLTGTWAIIIWVAIGLVAAFVLYSVGARLSKWARGEYQFRSPEREE